MRPRTGLPLKVTGDSGFTLFEALVSVALMGAIVFMLSAVSGKWIPNWHRGFGRAQRMEGLDIGLQRLVADLQAAQFVRLGGAAAGPLFDGQASSVTLVRDAIGPDATPHLEVIRLIETVDERGFALVRERAAFAPLAAGAPAASQWRFEGPVVLIRAPFRASFSFAGPDRNWRESWAANAQLPTAVRILVRDAASDQILATSTAALLHVNVSPDCAQPNPPRDCPNSVAGPGIPDRPKAAGSSPDGSPTPAARQEL